MQGIQLTSKASIKLQCLFISKGDITEADKLYNYLTKDMKNLPDHDPVPLTWQQSTAQTANGIMAWLKENQDTLAQGYEFISTLIANRGALPSIAPIAEATEEAAEPLPPIN